MDITGPLEDFSLVQHRQFIAKMSGKAVILREGPKKPSDPELKKASKVKTENIDIIYKLPAIRKIRRLIKSLLDRDSNGELVTPTGVKQCGAPILWESGLTGHGVKVAIVDSGIGYHEDLEGKVLESKSFVRDFFKHPHGTHVAGTVAAKGSIVGVAPDASLIDVKVLNSRGSGSDKSTANGLAWINSLNNEGHNIQVVNMSLGGPTSSKIIKDQIQKLTDSGVLVLCASGNDGDGNDLTHEFNYPAADGNCTSVGACTVDGNVAPFSASNPEVDLVAVGVDVLSCVPGFQSYETWSGTSMATPHVAGVGALIFQHLNKYKMSPQDKLAEVTRILYKVFAVDIDREGRDNNTGHGMVVCKPIDQWKCFDRELIQDM